ncbi:hypothetical protein HWV62_37898 [Athelia sp. TMB]|nr:hypothetical protein HWV62_37898 [Athelia sp. TMB]
MSDTDSVIDLTSSPTPSRKGNKDEIPTKLPKSNTLCGKSFVITGTWLTMSSEQAKELCKANGGRVLDSPSKAEFLVVGASGPPQDKAKLPSSVRIISEKDFLDWVLDPEGNSNHTGQKRALDDPTAGPSKPSKAAKTSAPVPASATTRPLKYVTAFLYSGDIELKKKSLSAGDCGGTVKKIQRGKDAIDLLYKFEDWLASCDGVRSTQ